MTNLEQLWRKLARPYCKDQKITSTLWHEIKASYTEKQRYYHNLDHLSYIIERLIPLKEYIEDMDTVLFAVFYHDLVYNVKNGDNEEKSASLAADRLHQLGVPPEQINRCRRHITATKNHESSPDRDTSYLTDADLAILGEAPAIYNAYRQKIRQEYAIYPDLLYKQGRKKVLKHFLAMNQIFKTPEFVSRYEASTRKNLQAELSSL